MDVQGHRGARGVLPENSIAGFLYALKKGVNTLEMDVAISKDHQIVVSHEPWMSHEICMDTLGQFITENEAMQYNIFQMNYEEIKKFDCGSKPHPRFPNQQKIKSYKPLLSEVIDSVESYTALHHLPQVFYNIETKCRPEGDNIFHPEPQLFSELLIDLLQKKNILSRAYIQSFDIRTLQFMNQHYPEIKTILLIENNKSAEENLKLLGFTPYAFSPDYHLVNEKWITFCLQKNIKLIPWTVNEKNDIESMLNLQVDGIISDYPELVLQILKSQKIKPVIE